MALFFNVVGCHVCFSLCILGFVNFLSWKIWNSTQFTWYKVESFSLRITKCLYTDANNFDKSIWIGRGRGGGRRYNCYLSGPYTFLRYRLIQHGPPPKNGCLPYWSHPNRFLSSKWFYFIPHLTYCHLVWNFCKSSDSRKIERNAHYGQYINQRRKHMKRLGARS